MNEPRLRSEHLDTCYGCGGYHASVAERFICMRDRIRTLEARLKEVETNGIFVGLDEKAQGALESVGIRNPRDLRRQIYALGPGAYEKQQKDWKVQNAKGDTALKKEGEPGKVGEVEKAGETDSK